MKIGRRVKAGWGFATLSVGLAWAVPAAASSKVEAPAVERVPASAPVPSPSPSVSPSPVASSDVPLTPAEARTLMQEFLKAQRTEVRAVDHHHQAILKELKASQAARLKEWEGKEREARHKFFAEHSKGAERRGYIKDFLDRRKALFKILSDERTNRTHEYDVRRKSLRDEQATKLKDFRAFVDKHKRPPVELWPTNR